MNDRNHYEVVEPTLWSLLLPQIAEGFSMESCVISDKLLVNLWGASISADGVWAIGAAVVMP
jgi:hypothetical protein